MAQHVLVPCGGCARHVRSSERACPFCGAELAACEGPCARVEAPPAGWTGRAQIMTFGVVVGAAAVATALTTGGCIMAYGAPPEPERDAGADAAPPPADAGDDSGGPAPAYGAPP